MMCRRFSLAILFFTFILVAHSQSIKSNATITVQERDPYVEVKTDPTVVQADFVAFIRFGEAPLSVLFKDLSTGNPTKWVWDFGDGSVDSVQYPVHIFQFAGSYTVKLTVSDGNSNSTVKKVDYIIVVNQGGCDTLNFPLPGDYALYGIIGENSGYVSGNNTFGDLAKASYFTEYESGRLLTGAIFDFAIAKRSLTNDIKVYFKMWKNDGVEGKPGTAVDSVGVNISDLVADVEQFKPTMIFFESQIALDGPFYLGVVLPQIFGDTLALFTNYDDDPPVGNGWEQNADGSWYSYNDGQSWGLNIDNAIFPIVCEATGVEEQVNDPICFVFPNPADDELIVVTDISLHIQAKISLYDVSGQRVMETFQMGQPSVVIHTGHLKNGLYLLKFVTDDKTFSHKVLIHHSGK
mgnify:CR=1 FL=1